MANKLPEEVVAHILSFLSLSDRKACSLVCWKWYYASRYPLLMRDIVTQMVVARNAHKTSNPDWQYSLINVSFHGIDITSKDFVVFLSSCPRLQSLDLSCCNSLVLGGEKTFLANEDDVPRLKATLRNLRSINLTSLRHLTDATFNRLMAIAENLTSLNLSGCPISFVGQISSSIRMNCLLTFPNIFNYLKEQRYLINSLNFSQTSIGDSSLDCIASISGLELKAIFLDKCQELTDRGIDALSSKQTSLEVFSMAHNSEIRAACISNLLTRCPQISVLDLSRCARLQEHYLKTLSSECFNIRSLNLSSNNTLTGRALARCFTSKHFSSVTILNLAHCTEAINDAAVIQVCGTMFNLRVLDLTSAFAITDASLNAICGGLVKLHTLKLGWCKGLTDFGFLGLPAPKKDDHLFICNCCQDYDSKSNKQRGYLMNKPCHPSISNLSRLQILDVSKCGMLTDCTFVHGLKLKELQQLDTSMIRGVTDKTLVALSTYAPSLEVLNISSSRITDHGLALALPNLKRLRSLSVANCDFLSDVCLYSILTYCQALREIDVSYCGLITDEQMDQFELKAIHVPCVKRMLIGTKFR